MEEDFDKAIKELQKIKELKNGSEKIDAILDSFISFSKLQKIQERLFSGLISTTEKTVQNFKIQSEVNSELFSQLGKFELDIKNGEFDLLSSGVIITASVKPVIITVHDNGEPLHITIKFENDKEVNEAKRNVERKGSNNLIITFINHNNPLGNYTNIPWLIGQANDKYLYFNYVISGIEAASVKKIEYSFYLGVYTNKKTITEDING